MQERYFPIVRHFVNGDISHESSYGPGMATPEEAHQVGLAINPNLRKIGTEWVSSTYLNRVQALWVSV